MTGETDNVLISVGDFNTPLWWLRKPKISKDIEDINDATTLIDINDMIEHSIITIVENVYISNALGTSNYRDHSCHYKKKSINF